MRIKQLFLSCAALFFISGLIADERWTDFASTASGAKFSFKTDSFAFGRTDSGEEMVMVVGKVDLEGSVALQQWSVTLGDCNRSMGAFVISLINGELIQKRDFVFGAGGWIEVAQCRLTDHFPREELLQAHP